GIESCFQYTMTNIKIDPNIVRFFVGRELAPGGYAWVFPKGNGVANVGLGILGTYAKRVNPEKSLKKFIARYFPNGSVISQTAGGVPVLPGLKRMVSDGVILAGDAARQVNPLSGGGIVTGMLAGDLAASHAVRALAEGDISESNLKAYQKEWDKLKGRENRRFYKLKKTIDNIEDDVFNDLVSRMSELPLEKRTVFAFFKKVLFSHPGLIVDAAKLFLK
ncbi:NAD(P)/FAD-dependent oxidoreductase, partial [bacterium]|nr:NAD(P)/FAD-dependent oxidoreductase [bacterium]